MIELDALPLDPAVRAVLAAVRSRLRGESSGEPEAGAAGADPPAVARLAERHGLEGIVAAARPAAAVDALEAVAGNLERIRELHRVLEILAEADVPVRALKGPALAVQAWDDVSARSYADVDVLVPPERASETVAALAAAGYVDRRVKYGRTPSPEVWHDWSFTAPDGRTLVEIHWGLVAPARYPAVDTREAWAPGGSVSVALPGGTVDALAPELLLPYLSAHASAHHWGWLEFPFTLAGLVRRSGDALDLEAALERARRWRVARITAVGLLLAEAVAGPGLPVLPEAVARRLQADVGAEALARWYGARLVLEDPTSEWYRGSPALWWRALRLRDSWPERVRAGAGLLFGATTAEWTPTGGEASAPERGEVGSPAPLRRVRRLFRRWRGGP